MKKNKYRFLMGFILLLTVSFTSCKDENDFANKPISITKIYLEDYKSTVPDRPVTFARLGQLIRIEGSGFLGMKKVIINGYDTYFNTAYITDNSMLINISNKTPIVNAEADLRNKISFVKDGTSFTYDFVIRAAAPSITNISNTLPKAGELVKVYGENLQEIVKIILPGAVELTEGIISDVEGGWFSFVMPDGLVQSGSIYSEGANGLAASPAYFNMSSCMVLDFDGNGKQGYWGWSATGSMINADDLVNDPLSTGRGKCVQLIPERILSGTNGGVIAGKSRATECWTAGNDVSDDWTRMYSLIPASTPVTEVAFQFDVYVPDNWSNTGHIEVVLYNNFNFAGIGSDDDNGRVAYYAPYIQNGAIIPFNTPGWVTVTIPFSTFGYYAKQIAEDKMPLFENVVNDRLAATYHNFGMGIVNTDFKFNGVSITSTLFSQKIYTDNWRVVPCAKVVVSDFNDDVQ